MKNLIACFVMIAPPALAGVPESPGLYWAKDGSGAIIVEQTGEDEFETSLVDTVDGNSVKDRPQIEAWAKRHPVAEAVPASRSSPDKKAKADVVPPAEENGAWDKTSWSPMGSSDWSLVVLRDGKSWPSTTCGGGDTIEAYWSADGTRIIWDVYHRGHAMRDAGYHEYMLGPAGLPRVGVVALKSSLGTSGRKVAEAVGKAGLVVSSLTATKTRRPSSVVYAAKGFEDRAKDLVGKIPGGATVGTIDWKAPYDLIVAVGDSVK